MCAHEAGLELLAASLDLQVHRDTAGVAGNDGGLLGDLLDALPQIALGGQLLDDRFQNPVGVLQLAQIVFQIAHSDQGRARRVHEGSGAGFHGAGNSTFRRCVAVWIVWQNDVQQGHGNASVGELRGNRRAHHARADNGSFLYFRCVYVHGASGLD